MKNLSKKQKKNLITRFIILIVVFLFLQMQIAFGNTFILESPSKMSSRITKFEVIGLKTNDTNIFFVVDYQVYNSGPFTVYSGKAYGGKTDLYLPFSLLSSNANLSGVFIYNMAIEGGMAGGVDKIKPGIHDYNTSYEIIHGDFIEDYNYTLPDGEYHFSIGKTNWYQIYGVNLAINGENYTVDYEIPIGFWSSDVSNFGDPFLIFYGCFSIIILIGPIIFKNLRKQPDWLKKSKL